jgi:uncharacterized membrane protein affecting hemolysin expression
MKEIIMKPYMFVAVSVLLVAGVQAFSSASQRSDHEHHQQLEFRSTAAIQEPTGYSAACFATNLDTERRTLAATIYDWRGNNVTSTSSCGTNQGPGITCQSTALYTDSALRCVVSTTGSAAHLRGSLSTSAGPYPFTSGQAANSTLSAE